MPNSRRLETALASLIEADVQRLALLETVSRLDLPDCWIGAGFVRSAVWDRLHDRKPATSWDDIDVIWFDPNRIDPAIDHQVEARLRQEAPGQNWSVKNQARMHLRNGDEPCRSIEQAISRWPETATAVAIRRKVGATEILSPHGLDDLFGLILRPTPFFLSKKRSIFDQRLAEKRWLERWPLLSVARFPRRERTGSAVLGLAAAQPAPEASRALFNTPPDWKSLQKCREPKRGRRGVFRLTY
jgi:hypothetical protein